MIHEELLKILEKTMGKADVTKCARSFTDADAITETLLDLTFHHQSQVAFRAAWVLENVLLHAVLPPRFLLEKFIAGYPLQMNRSCRRHYTRIMMHLLKDHQVLNGIDLEPVAEATFEWLIDPENPVAVKVNCLDVLLALSRYHRWIREELGLQTEFLMRNGSAAIRVRGKKILRELA